MDRQEMLERLANGESPLDVSIQKWKEVVIYLENGGHYDNIHLGIDTCALCEKTNFICKQCQYQIHYGYNCCNDESAYMYFLNSLEVYEKLEIVVELAQNMVAELEAIKKEKP